MIGYTHKWNDYLRSTASYGYVHLDNQFSQEPDAYHQTHYASLNLVWKARKRLSIGFEALYGHKEEKSGARWRCVPPSNRRALFDFRLSDIESQRQETVRKFALTRKK